MDKVYRFEFRESVPNEKIEEILFWAVLDAESVFGKSKVRLDASFLFDKDKKVAAVDGGTEVGQLIAQLFTSFITRELGGDCFRVERLSEPNAKRNEPQRDAKPA